MQCFRLGDDPLRDIIASRSLARRLVARATVVPDAARENNAYFLNRESDDVRGSVV